LVRTLVLARLLLPEHFGLVAIGATTLGIANSVSNLGIIPALVQRRDPERVHYDTAWTVGVLRALLITGVIALAAPYFARAFEAPEATNIVRAMGLRPLFEALASIQVARLTRDLDFRGLAAIRVPPALIDLILAASLAGTLGVWAMVIGTLAGAVAVIVLSYAVAPHRPRLTIDNAAAGALIHFGRWIFLEGLLAMVGGALIQLVISRNLGVAALGLYSLAGKLAFLPYQFASQVVGSVAFPLYARLQDDLDRVGEAFRGLFSGMACLLVPVYAVIIFLAPDLVEHVLSSDWQGTAPVIQVLAFVGALGLFADAASPLIQGLGYPRMSVVVEGVQTVLILASVQLLAARFGVEGAAGAWIPAVGVAQLLSAYYVIRLVPKPFAGLAGPVLAVVVASLAAGALSAALAERLSGPIGALSSGAIAGVVALLFLWILDRRFDLGFVDGVVKIFPQAASYLR
jgi:O-antigen/teichoic acid export membrane protein